MINNELIKLFFEKNICKKVESCISKIILPDIYNHKDIFEYIENYIPEKMYFSRAGGLLFLAGDDIISEINPESWPGGIVFNYGFFPIARTIGGNLVCMSNKDGSLHLADHSYIREDRVCYYNETNTRLLSAPINIDSIHQYTPLLASNINEMIEKLLEGEDSPYAMKIFELG